MNHDLKNCDGSTNRSRLAALLVVIVFRGVTVLPLFVVQCTEWLALPGYPERL